MNATARRALGTALTSRLREATPGPAHYADTTRKLARLRPAAAAPNDRLTTPGEHR